MLVSLLFWLLSLLLAPLLLGIINRTKAVFAGRHGAPLLQPWFDLLKLMRKGTVYSNSTTWVFRAGPIISLAAILMAGLLMPLNGVPAPIAFPGDLVLFAYLLGVARFVTVLAALDTGSSFEGMGSSREVWIASLAEPALFLAFGALVRHTGHWSISAIMSSLTAGPDTIPISILLGIALFLVVLAENSRIPVDDPNTHLELTMIHEVMVLDHSGIDFAYILYGAALKLWLTGALLMNILLPFRTGTLLLDGLIGHGLFMWRLIS